MAERMFLTPMGEVNREGYVRYLREAANRWRHAPLTGGTKEWRERQRSGNEEQARRVEAKADRIEQGRDE